MDIKSFPFKTDIALTDYLLLQDAQDLSFRSTTKENLLKGISGSGSGNSPWQIKNATYTAKAGDKLIVDTTTNWVLTLPATNIPIDIELIGLPSVATNNLLVQGLNRFEGKEVLSLSLKQPYRSVTLTYLDSTNGWTANPDNVITPNYPVFAKSLPGLLLNIRSSNGITANTSGLISAINDLSDNRNNLNQTTSSRQPFLVANGFSTHPVLRFNDGNQWLDFTTRLTTIRSIYWVIKYSSSGTYSFLLGDVTAFDFHAGTNTYFDGNSSAAIRNGNFRINGITQAPTSFTRNTNVNTISLVTTANVNASAFSADRGNGFGSRSWIGDLLYLAIFDVAHNSEQISQMESYLRSEYGHY